MAQTLRKSFSFQSIPTPKSFFEYRFRAPMSIERLLTELRSYLALAENDLLQPRQQCIDRLMQAAELY